MQLEGPSVLHATLEVAETLAGRIAGVVSHRCVPKIALSGKRSCRDSSSTKFHITFSVKRHDIKSRAPFRECTRDVPLCTLVSYLVCMVVKLES
jgi:hypothetical protein